MPSRFGRLTRGLLAFATPFSALFALAFLLAVPAARSTAPRPAAAALAVAAPQPDRTGLRAVATAAPHGHAHATPADPAPVVERGRLNPVGLTGTTFRTQVVEDRLLVRARPGVVPARRELERALAALDLRVERFEPALDLFTLSIRGADRPAAAAARVAALPWVAWAEPDFVATIAEDIHAPFTTGDSPIAAWNAPTLASSGIPAAWATTTGSPSLTIAVLDTGVFAGHPEFSGRLVAGWDFVNGDGDPNDDSGHGTAMTGLIVARGDDSLGLTGVAWNCKVMPIKVADWQGNASLSDLVSGILYAVDHGAKILNVSLGSRVGSSALADAVEYAWSHGSLVVAAVGNDNTNAALYPAAYPHAVAVASTTEGPDLGFVTNISKLTTVAAPGARLVTTIPGNYYREVSGTSASAALVSGVAALVWSKYPALTNAQVVAALKYGVNPIPALDPVKAVFRFGKLDAVKALARAAGSGIDVAVTRVECAPRAPLPGQATTVEVEVENQGVTPVAGVAVSATAGGAALATPPPTVSLAAGERAVLAFPWTPAAAGAISVVATAATSPGEADAANNSRARAVTVAAATDHAVQYVDIGADEPSPTAASLDFWYTVKNRGNVVEPSVTLRALYNGTEFGAAATVSLAPGATYTAHFAWPVPTPPPADTVSLVGHIEPAGYEPRPVEATGFYDFMLGSTDTKPVHSQYQKSGSIDIIPDAPYRVNAGRPYLPLQVFVPDKGSSDTLTALSFDDFKIWQKTTPDGTPSGTLLYADSMSDLPAAIPPGLVILDEMGVPQVSADGAPDANLFRDQPLDLRGRHNILRIPRSALGVPPYPAAPVTQFYWVTVDWSFNHHIMTWTATSHGTTKKMLKVVYGSAGITPVPFEGRYYDTHVHTIAEWHYSSSLDIFSPEQSHGGPLQMFQECAYVLGLIDAPEDVFEKMVTTDHNCFYGSPIDPIPNSPLRRPPVGPTAPAHSMDAAGHVKSEYQRMREIFGDTAGEEVAFSQNLLSPAPLPIGAHMLVYRAQHFDGTWHGGSDIASLLHEGPPLYLESVLTTLASTNPAENAYASAYAAHPFSGQGWNTLNLNRTLGLLPIHRDHALVSLATGKFVLKGLQLFNGRGSGGVPASEITWNNMNPWAYPAFGASGDWDRELQIGLRNWHQYLATDLDYNFVDEPGKKFPRKIYIEGGTDAHGNFNYSEGRLATQINLPSTFALDTGAFGAVRTFTFGAGKPGATVEKRAMAALADGNSCATDGPVVYFDMDSDGRFDSAALKWHDAGNVAENGDGRMGGDGAYDGGRTMLVRKGNPDVHFRYLWTNAADLGSAGGAVAAIRIYKDEPGTPNPTMARAYGAATEPVIKGVGALVPGAPAVLHSKLLNPAEEGLITKRAALSLGAFTGSDPNVAPLGAYEYRCYTNPVWAMPVDISVSVTTSGITTASPVIPAGAIVAKFTFAGSMMTLPYAVHIKKLDGAGNSTDVSVPPASTCSPLLSWTWDYTAGIADAIYTVKNDAPIPLSGATYPAAGKYTFVVYFKDAPKDLHGNALNSVAKTFVVDAPVAPASSKKCFLGALSAGSQAGWLGGSGTPGGGESAWAALAALLFAVVTRNRMRPRM